MKVKDLINKLNQMPQDVEVEVEILHQMLSPVSESYYVDDDTEVFEGISAKGNSVVIQIFSF